MVIPTYSFVSLHHLPRGGEHHGGRVHVADVPAVGPHLHIYHLLSYLQFHSDGLIFAANCCILIAIIMI